MSVCVVCLCHVLRPGRVTLVSPSASHNEESWETTRYYAVRAGIQWRHSGMNTECVCVCVRVCLNGKVTGSAFQLCVSEHDILFPPVGLTVDICVFVTPSFFIQK